MGAYPGAPVEALKTFQYRLDGLSFTLHQRELGHVACV